MNCFRANRMISAYIDGELPGVEVLQMREHLRVCRRCNDEYDSLLALKRRLGALATCEPRSGFDAMILQRVHQSCSVPATVHLQSPWWRPVAFDWRASMQLCGVALLGCITAVGIVHVHRMQGHSPRVAMARPIVSPVMEQVPAPPRPPMVIYDVIFLHDGTVPSPARPSGPILEQAAMRADVGEPRSEQVRDFVGH